MNLGAADRPVVRAESNCGGCGGASSVRTWHSILEFMISLVLQYCSIVLCYPVLSCALLHYLLLYCTVLCCTVLSGTVLFSNVLYCRVLFCPVLFCAPWYCSVLSCPIAPGTGFYCPIQYSIARCCGVLYCPVLSFFVVKHVCLLFQNAVCLWHASNFRGSRDSPLQNSAPHLSKGYLAPEDA